MRVFLAGATGVIGRRLVPMLLADGHQVTGMTRSPGKVDALRAVGVEPVVADALDAEAVRRAVSDARPDAVIHQLTSLPPRIDPRTIGRDFAMNDRLRSEGTRILVDAAQAAGATRILAQSIAFAYAPGPAGTVHEESDPLYVDSPEPFRRSARALDDLERTVVGAGGIALRYGYFYGPGSSISASGSMGEDLARRRMPIVGRGQGVWSFVHVDDAARATVAALTHGGPGAYNIVDDDPAPVARWLPALAEALGAKKPLRVPEWLARPMAGSYGVAIMTRAQGASNNLAKRELGWKPEYSSWREGFRTALG
ncbi:MAG TPA: NAD(P)-dependent oxidoreductase [Solirubrobacteraceae bacterium]|nr:NAD(P)-dependent oxidoreductase [Solirubrobacteraceae bacterium]